MWPHLHDTFRNLLLMTEELFSVHYFFHLCYLTHPLFFILIMFSDWIGSDSCDRSSSNALSPHGNCLCLFLFFHAEHFFPAFLPNVFTVFPAGLFKNGCEKWPHGLFVAVEFSRHTVFQTHLLFLKPAVTFSIRTPHRGASKQLSFFSLRACMSRRSKTTRVVDSTKRNSSGEFCFQAIQASIGIFRSKFSLFNRGTNSHSLNQMNKCLFEPEKDSGICIKSCVFTMELGLY